MNYPRSWNAATIFALSIIALGSSCVRPSASVGTIGANNMWVGDAISRNAWEDGVRVRRSLHPYHFDSGTAHLNPLGERDLKVLVGDFDATSAPIVLVRGGAADDLLHGRLDSVHAYLAAAGRPALEQQVVVGLPGGPGMPSSHALRALEASGQPTTTRTPVKERN